MAAKILLAEDDNTLRDTLAFALVAEGHDVVHAATGQAAIEEAMAKGIDVAVIDMLLPKVPGFEVAAALRAARFHGPIIFMSGVLKTAAHEREGREKFGARAFLSKPFTPAQLVDAINSLVSSTTAPMSRANAAAAREPQRPVADPRPSAAVAQPVPEKGNLLELPIPYLLWRLLQERQSCIVEIFEPDATARLFVLRGNVVFAQHSAQDLHTGIELVRLSAVTAETLHRCADLAVEREQGLLDVIRTETAVTTAQIEEAHAALIVRILARVGASSGQYQLHRTEGFVGVVPPAPVGLHDALIAAVHQLGATQLELHIGPRRPLRLAPGETWAEVTPLLERACGSASLARAINGRATVAQLIEAAPNSGERLARLRQTYLLMSCMAVRASLEPIAMPGTASPAPAEAVANRRPPTGEMPVASMRPPTGEMPVATIRPAATIAPAATPAPPRPAAPPPMPAPAPAPHKSTNTPGVAPPAPTTAIAPEIDRNLDAGLSFTAEDIAARDKIAAKFNTINGLDYFAILGVTKTNDAATIKKQYLLLAREFHTDAFGTRTLGAAQRQLDHVFSTIQTAYDTLTNDKLRGEYEARLSFESAGASTDIAAILAAEAEMHKARLLVERGEIVGALKLVERVLTVTPNSEEALGYKAYCAWWQKKVPAEVPALARRLDELLKGAPGTLALREFQGWLWLEAGDLKAAQIAFKRVLEKDAAHPGATRGVRAITRKKEEQEKAANTGLGRFLKR